MESKLQIISGVFRGRKLRLPKNARPTQNRARIALFNMLESGIIEFGAKMSVWDTFAGSGAFGIECLSRYLDARVLFTDVAPDSIKTVRDNLAKLNVDARASVVQSDAIGVISRYGADIDLVFVDCPYDMPELGRSFVLRIARVAKHGMILIWEQESNNSVMPDENQWNVLRDKTYGRARFLILQKK